VTRKIETAPHISFHTGSVLQIHFSTMTNLPKYKKAQSMGFGRIWRFQGHIRLVLCL
jgi:ATP-dependent DNA ligase